MPGSLTAVSPRRAGPPRALVICAAVVLGLAVGSASRIPPASAQEAKAPPAAPGVPAPPAEAPKADPAAAPAAKAGATSKSSTTLGSGDRGVTIEATIKTDSDSTEARADAEPGSRKRTVTITKGDKTVTVTGGSDDPELDSFDEMVRTQPEFFGMVIAVVAVVFLAPVLAIALILGYRMRKTRMQNETLLKLAERGALTGPQAMAVVAGAVPLGAVPPPADPAREVRKRAAWSDLRKGVVMTAIGLAISVYSTVGHGYPNVFGLVLLFLGIGYGVLWWFEQRQIASAPTPAAGPAPEARAADRGSSG